MTESTSSGLYAFVSGLNFTSFPDSSANMQMISSGYLFDFSALSVTIPPLPTPLVTPAGPSLERLTTNAVAASTQRGNALVHHWTELELPLTSLPLFLAAMRRSPIVIPFDWNRTGNLSTGAFFPPAAACIDSLTLWQAQTIKTLETNAFGLAPIVNPSSQTNCSLHRPTYGIVNLLHLRLPFVDSDTRRDLPKQGVILNESNKSRYSFHAGELLDISATTPSSPSLPDRFGVIDHLDHVVLAYLTLLDRSLAKTLVEFVLGSGSDRPIARLRCIRYRRD